MAPKAMFAIGDMVWATMRPYPAWPARVRCSSRRFRRSLTPRLPIIAQIIDWTTRPKASAPARHSAWVEFYGAGRMM
jgi:hypothetical protein